MSALVLYSPPAMAPELRAQVERLIAGPVRLPGVDAEDPGMVLTPEPEYHPGAQAEADAKRAALVRPMEPQAIRLWAQTFAAGHSNAPRDETDFAMWLSALIFTCGDDVPGGAWDVVALREASREFSEFWPSAGKVFKLLEARALRLQREIAALERIAKGERVRRGPVRESSVPYVLPMPPPERPAHPSMPKGEPGSDLVRIDPVAKAQTLADFGPIDHPNVDRLAARRAQLERPPVEVEAVEVTPGPVPMTDDVRVRLVKALATPRRRAQGGRR